MEQYMDKLQCITRAKIMSGGGLKLQIVFVIFTIAVIGSFIYFFIQRDGELNEVNHRKAIELSDYGMQVVGKTLVSEKGNDVVYTNPWSLKSVARTELNNGWYMVTIKVDGSDSAVMLKVSSIGYYGSQENSQYRVLKLHRRIDMPAGDTIWLPE
jgi:hypothetical protein